MLSCGSSVAWLGESEPSGTPLLDGSYLSAPPATAPRTVVTTAIDDALPPHQILSLPTRPPTPSEADTMLLLDYQNVLIQNVLTERFSGFAQSPSPVFRPHLPGSPPPSAAKAARLTQR